MKDKKTLLFVESPLQLINAFEAIDFFKLKNYKIYVRYSYQKRNDIQIKSLLKKFKIENKDLHVLKIAIVNRSFIDFLTFLYFYICVIFRYSKHCNIFIGNIESGLFKYLLKIFNRDQIILLDDGTKTLVIQENFSVDNVYNLFSIFELKKIKNQVIYKNSYSLLAKLCTGSNVISDKIIFIGSKIAEEGLLTNEEDYLKMLKLIADSYDENIIYIPHREECENKLKKVDLIKNVNVVYIDYPIELYGLIENIIPCKLISFFSTALYSLNIIYPNVEIISYKFDYSLSSEKDEIDLLYESYKHKFTVIEI